MLQKELAKRLKARYDTKMDGNGWLEVSSDGIPLCRIKYNGQFLSNADQNLSDEYRSKIADIQDEISTVREYVGLYEHAPQMSLLRICAAFAKYFSTGNADPQKDMLLFTNCTLLLTDEEFSGYLSEINQVTVKYMKQASSESSKPRRITLISAPTNE